MTELRQIAIGQDAPDAVTVDVRRDENGRVVATVSWPSGGAAGDYFASVPEALHAARAAQEHHGLAEIVVALESDDLWDQEWGHLPLSLTEEEAFELARATEASRDA